jgi:hypothetical protein
MFLQFLRISSVCGPILILSGCASVNYDDQADSQLTSITQEVNQQFITWENQSKAKAAPYDPTFYNKLEADLQTLEIRMEASQDPATQNLIPVFDSLNQQVENLRQLHQTEKTLPAEFFHAERQLLDAQLAALITYELSLKPSAIGGSPAAKTQSTAVATAGSKATAAQAAVSKVAGQ